MKILFMDWKSYCSEDMIPAFEEQHCQVVRIPFTKELGWKNDEYEESLLEMIRLESPDFIFSFNYFPLVSRVCQKEGLLYVSWVYDTPHVAIYSNTIHNACNVVFLFDQEQFRLFHDTMKIQTIYYLPLAANTKRLDQMLLTPALQEQYSSDISFVGSLYTEEKHQLFERMKNLNTYDYGYLKGLMESQLLVYGANFLEESLSKELVQKMLQIFPMLPNPDGMETSAWLYSEYMLNRHVTSLERSRTLSFLAETFQVKLFTHDTTYQNGKVTVCGPVDYYDTAPFVYKSSRINLNITLRSIKSGIPLRAFDIMGSHGLLMTSFTSDFLEFFVPGKDFILYENQQDLLEKTAFYLEHEEEAQEIALQGYNKVKAEHTFSIRAAQIVNALT